MIEPAYAQSMARYNRWMNDRLYAVCAELPDSQRRRDRGAFFGSIHGTLNHLLLGDRLWLGRFLARPFAVDALDRELHAGFADLRAARSETDAEIDAWAQSLTAEALVAPFSFRSVDPGADHRFPLAHLVVHFFNHQTHHRGQLTALISQAGAEPGVTDLLWLPGAALA